MDSVLSLDLHHCQDDEVVEIEHLALNAARFPDARPILHAAGGHQFEGLAHVLATHMSGVL